MMTADFSRGLPDLRSGVWRHYKGHFYFVFGYGHDANSDALQALIPVLNDPAPSAVELCERVGVGVGAQAPHDRAVVVYMGLELDDAHKGPRLAIRTAEDFFALVCSVHGTYWECTEPICRGEPVARFEYAGPAWYGWSRGEAPSSGTRPAPDTAAAPPSEPGTPERMQPWAPCPVLAPHEPHGPDAPRPKCPGVPPRHKVNTTQPYDGRPPGWPTAPEETL